MISKESVGIWEKWKDGRCVATLGVDNIFNRYNSYFSNVPSYSSQNRFELASSGRLMKLTFTWNFNHGKKSGAVTVEKKSASERSRIEGK